MIKYIDIVIFDLSPNSIDDLREWAKPENPDCEISIGSESDIKLDKNATEIYFNVADAWPTSYLDTKIIAKFAKVRMILN